MGNVKINVHNTMNTQFLIIRGAKLNNNIALF